MSAVLHEYPAYGRLPQAVVAAEGCELVLADGRRLLDLYGGHCVNVLGGGDAELGAALAEAWQRLSFVSNLLEHGAREPFLAALAPTLPAGDWQVFCSNSGAEANENALKMALAATGRSRVAAFTGGFHGRTAAAAAVSDTQTAAFPAAPFEVLRLPWGDLDCAAAEIDAAVGAVIVEPIQSLAGVRVPPRGFLEGLLELCHGHGALLVFDEVQTGSGRTGSYWAAEHYGVHPDLLTTAKGCGGGMPVGLTLARGAVAEAVPAGLLGSTFGGGPLALAAATAVARRIAGPGFLDRVGESGAALAAAAEAAGFASVRGAGLLLGLELPARLDGRAVRNALLERGVLVGTSNDPHVLRLTPPLVLEPEHAGRFSAALASLDELREEVPA